MRKDGGAELSLDDVIKVVLGETTAKGFDQDERHEACNVARSAYRYALTHKLNPDTHALTVSRQYIAKEIDKWQRPGYKNSSARDGQKGVSHDE